MDKVNTQKIGKSGYEIRLEVLQRALDMADARFHYQNEAARFEAEKTSKSSLPILPDNRVEDALQIAEKLYRFVEAK